MSVAAEKARKEKEAQERLRKNLVAKKREEDAADGSDDRLGGEKKKTNMVYIKKDMNRTSMINSPPPDFPTLVKHKSQDISLSSQQSDGSTSRVI